MPKEDYQRFFFEENPEFALLLFGEDFLKEALFLLKSFFVGALFLFGLDCFGFSSTIEASFYLSILK
jgi:hypothetical protein